MFWGHFEGGLYSDIIVWERKNTLVSTRLILNATQVILLASHLADALFPITSK